MYKLDENVNSIVDFISQNTGVGLTSILTHFNYFGQSEVVGRHRLKRVLEHLERLGVIYHTAPHPSYGYIWHVSHDFTEKLVNVLYCIQPALSSKLYRSLKAQKIVSLDMSDVNRELANLEKLGMAYNEAGMWHLG